MKNKYQLISLSVLGIYLLPFTILGENSYILIHDMLDVHISNFKLIADNNLIFADSSTNVPQMMEAQRVSFGNELNFLYLLFSLFDPYDAYVINQFVIRIIAYFGMYLLLDRYILKRRLQAYSSAISLLYSLLPFYATAGLSIAGLPLITYIFLNIRNQKTTAADWLVLLMIPFYSSFVFSMMFYCFFLFLGLTYDIINSKFKIKFTLAVFIFFMLYLIINYRLLEVFLMGSDFVSHRTEFSALTYNFIESIKKSITHFILGQYHAHSHHIILIPFIVITFILNLISRKRNKLIISLFMLNFLISIWYGFWKYEGWESVKESISLLRTLNLSRFHFLTPLLWYLLFSLSLKYLVENFKSKIIIVLIWSQILFSIIYLFYKSDFTQTYLQTNITYKQFFAESQFDDIENYIGKTKSKYKVASIGIHPSIVIYNEFYTLDGYLPNYNLNYKHKFREIIAAELSKNEKLKNKFDNWGSRCYIFVDEVGYNFVRKKDEVYPINIDINTRALWDLGGKYIFSSYPIINSSENKLKFIKIFKDKNSAWDIYLYEVEGTLK